MANRRSLLRGALAAACLTTTVACGSDAPTGVSGTGAPSGTSSGAYPGFDVSVYPGDAAMRAWLYPASPYYWAGYYLLAPCHRDGSWTGKRATVAGIGWGITAIYVGQQDWRQIPGASVSRAGTARFAAESGVATCSAALLSASQGTAEAADAIARMVADGFLNQSIVFLDVEYVTAVTPELVAYYRAWIGAVVADGRYQPGVYAAKSNASTLYDAASAEYRARGRSGAPPFWIASSTGFSIASKPAAVGFDFATLWQGMFDVTQSWSGVPITIDVDVATTRSPSTP